MIESTPISYSFPKVEKLVSQKAIDQLFASGKSFIAYPLRVVYSMPKEEDLSNQSTTVLVSVSKRKFKRAVKRNRVKRQIREAYRLNKHALSQVLIEKGMRLEVAFLYLKDELPDYAEIDKAMNKAIGKLIENANIE